MDVVIILSFHSHIIISFSCWHECIIKVHHCTHSCTVAWGQTKHSSSHSTGMRQGSRMVSDCIQHRAAGTEFGHASEVTFSEMGIIIMMNVTVSIHTITGHFFKSAVATLLHWACARQQDLDYYRSLWRQMPTNAGTKKQQRQWDDCLMNWFIVIQLSEQCSSGPISYRALWQTWTTTLDFYKGTLRKMAMIPIYAVDSQSVPCKI